MVPASNGGSAITDYIIQRSPNGTTGWVTINDGVNVNTAYTVTGLTNGTRYYFRVFARNAVGNSPTSNIANAIPRTVPGYVSFVRVVAYFDGFDFSLGRPGEHRWITDHRLRSQAYDYDTRSRSWPRAPDPRRVPRDRRDGTRRRRIGPYLGPVTAPPTTPLCQEERPQRSYFLTKIGAVEGPRPGPLATAWQPDRNRRPARSPCVANAMRTVPAPAGGRAR